MCDQCVLLYKVLCSCSFEIYAVSLTVLDLAALVCMQCLKKMKAGYEWLWSMFGYYPGWQNFADLCCRFGEKGNLEILLFTIQSKMRANNQKPFLPREGRMLADINRAWEHLEKAEHERELALRDELIRLVTGVTCIKFKMCFRHLWMNILFNNSLKNIVVYIVTLSLYLLFITLFGAEANNKWIFGPALIKTGEIF